MKVKFLPDQRIAREAAKLVDACKRDVPAFAIPFDLDVLVWDHLNRVDELALDDETDLREDEATGDAILGKTVLEERKIYLSPSLRGQPYERFTLAHEIGHWILHCRPLLPREGELDLLGETEPMGSAGSVFTTFNRTVFSPSQVRDPIEVQANKFAACLLMPEREFREVFSARFGNCVEVKGEREAVLAEARRLASLGGTTTLREVFGTSVESTAYRIATLGLAVSTNGTIFE